MTASALPFRHVRGAVSRVVQVRWTTGAAALPWACREADTPELKL